MSAHALLLEEPDRSTEEWRTELAGNLCRCTGYQSIVEGVERAAELLRAPEATP
jgi:carbon-monoxide dehydrogenase small subunit